MHLSFSRIPPPHFSGLSRASSSESNMSQVSHSLGSLESSKGKLLVSHHSLYLCLKVADAIMDSLGLLVEVMVSEEFGM